MNTSRKSIYLTVAGTLLLVLLSVAMFVHKLTAPRVMSNAELQLNGAYVFDKPRIIEPLQLLDQDGKPFTLENLQQRWSLVFFGYTYCPDICPTTMADLKKFWALLEDTPWREDTQVILATVDPGRDTPDKLRGYVRYFDESFVGITGDFMQLQSFARNLNAAFTKVPGGTADAYLVDHTPNIALINPYGHYHGFFKPARAPGGMFDPGMLKLTYQSIRASFHE